MHRHIVPKQSGVHRFACLSLYRALLHQCRSPKNAAWLDEARGVVQHSFRRYKNLQSPSQTVNALRAGYEALDLIFAAHTDPNHQEKVTRLISRAKLHRDRFVAKQEKARSLVPPPPPLTPRAARKAESIRFQNETALRHPDAKPILDRPRPLGDKVRHVPVLVNSRGVPYLRIKKPIPQNLSNAIRSKLAIRWRWIMRRDRLKVESLFAHDEEVWDRITGTRDLPAWTSATTNAIEETKAKINDYDAKNKKLAEDMWMVVLAERALAEEEAAALGKPEDKPEHPSKEEQGPEQATKPSFLKKLGRSLGFSNDTPSSKD
ncbi:hypothetical protein MYU51_014743 [Penicillium brevicompactum]|uniref:uncharacterized protein n=1 Tax=Penicillium brevicompactum TaxID=5074 RepID=UPI002540BC3A|nr:uncharacterized protein N7506_007030 [Penicillium brevicompactum]KAJ5333247.1 hypothetical protein N7506_007030 [Penicillium brevicompactum]